MQASPPTDGSSENKQDTSSSSHLQAVNVDRRPRKRKAGAVAQQHSSSPTSAAASATASTAASTSKQPQQVSAMAFASPWKSALRVSHGVQGNCAGQAGALTKNVRFSFVHNESPSQQKLIDASAATSGSDDPRNISQSASNNGRSTVRCSSTASVSSPLVKGPRATTSKNRRRQRATSGCSIAIFYENKDTNENTSSEVCA